MCNVFQVLSLFKVLDQSRIGKLEYVTMCTRKLVHIVIITHGVLKAAGVSASIYSLGINLDKFSETVLQM